MQTIAAIDIGSNAMRLLIGAVNHDGELQVIETTRLPVRLGQDVFSSQQSIQRDTAQLAVDAFKRFRKMADDHRVEKIRAVATSAMREAKNGNFLCNRIERETGIAIEIISSDEEARLIHCAVSQAVNLREKYAVSIDIGGGSVEVTLSLGNNILSTESYNMGTVRLLQILGEQPERLPFDKLVREYAQSAKRRIEREIGSKKIDLCIGTGGNIEEMGELRKKIFKRDSEKIIAVNELDEIAKILGAMSVDERMKKFKLKSDRADVIFPASVVLSTITSETRVKEILIPNVGLKDGVLIDMAQNLQITPRPSIREQVWISALNLGEKYQFDSNHARLVSSLAGSLFDQTETLHNLSAEYKLLLEVAALLHDIGHFINTIDHDKHAHYILQASPLIGLSSREQMIVANTARYHRKSLPNIQDENFRALPAKDRSIVIKLSTLLRLADAMDVSHTYRTKSVSIKKVKDNWKIKLERDGPLTLEAWALEKRRSTFQDVFGVKLEIEN
jgi:exopolyphosphatase/guanosine-5'-triphosphate,3'-diphosphate pyrophosphatase